TLGSTGLFPNTYLQMIEVADASGTLPETLERISPELEADARRSLTALVIASGWLIWMLVAAFIIFLIFSLFSFYLGMINQELSTASHWLCCETLQFMAALMAA